jgi:hypothetical protein
MVCNGARDEFDVGPSKCSGDILGIPAHVNRDLAHGELSREEAWLVVNDGLESLVAGELGCLFDPIVTQLVG